MTTEADVEVKAIELFNAQRAATMAQRHPDAKPLWTWDEVLYGIKDEWRAVARRHLLAQAAQNEEINAMGLSGASNIAHAEAMNRMQAELDRERARRIAAENENGELREEISRLYAIQRTAAALRDHVEKS